MYLLDDHEVVRQGLRALLECAGDIEVVGESGSAAGGHRPDPGAATRRRRPRRPAARRLGHRGVPHRPRPSTPSIKALILTSYDDDEALFAAIMAGASGYVLKEITGQDLIGAVRQVAAGNSLIDPALTARVLERVRNGPGTAPELAELTEQELKLLALIAEGLTNRQIGERMFLAEKTVKNYVSSILAKLGLERRTQAAVLASKLLDRGATPDLRSGDRARASGTHQRSTSPCGSPAVSVEVTAAAAAPRSPRVAQPALAAGARDSPTPSSSDDETQLRPGRPRPRPRPGRRARAGPRWRAPRAAPAAAGRAAASRHRGVDRAAGPHGRREAQHRRRTRGPGRAGRRGAVPDPWFWSSKIVPRMSRIVHVERRRPPARGRARRAGPPPRSAAAPAAACPWRRAAG